MTWCRVDTQRVQSSWRMLRLLHSLRRAYKLVWLRRGTNTVASLCVERLFWCLWRVWACLFSVVKCSTKRDGAAIQ